MTRENEILRPRREAERSREASPVREPYNYTADRQRDKEMWQENQRIESQLRCHNSDASLTSEQATTIIADTQEALRRYAQKKFRDQIDELKNLSFSDDMDNQIHQKTGAAHERVKKEQEYYVTQYFSDNVLQDLNHYYIRFRTRATSDTRKEQWKQLSADVSTVLNHRNGQELLDDTKQLVPIFKRIENTAKNLIEEATGAAPRTATLIIDEFARVRKKYNNDTDYAIHTMGINPFTGKQ